MLFTLLGLSLAAPQEDGGPQIIELPEFSPEVQTKIVELYELLKAELEGDEDLDIMEPLEPPQIEEITRNKRSAVASPFFFRRLFGFGRRHRGYGYRRSYGHGYNRGYRRSYGRHYYH